MPLTPFHLAIAVRNINEARQFYGVKMGFAEGRSTDVWIDFDMFGHQLVTHLNPHLGKDDNINNIVNDVEEKGVPIPHCGVVLELADWHLLAERVSGFIDEFIIEPYVRFQGQTGEQATMFFADPSGNALEFKGFKDIKTQLFAK